MQEELQPLSETRQVWDRIHYCRVSLLIWPQIGLVSTNKVSAREGVATLSFSVWELIEGRYWLNPIREGKNIRNGAHTVELQEILTALKCLSVDFSLDTHARALAPSCLGASGEGLASPAVSLPRAPTVEDISGGKRCKQEADRGLTFLLFYR